MRLDNQSQTDCWLRELQAATERSKSYREMLRDVPMLSALVIRPVFLFFLVWDPPFVQQNYPKDANMFLYVFCWLLPGHGTQGPRSEATPSPEMQSLRSRLSQEEAATREMEMSALVLPWTGWFWGAKNGFWHGEIFGSLSKIEQTPIRILILICMNVICSIQYALFDGKKIEPERSFMSIKFSYPIVWTNRIGCIFADS